MQPPPDNQIQHNINSVKIYNNKNCTLNKLKKWCEDRSTIPEDEDQVFLGKFEYLVLPKQEFRIFLTTKRLIKFVENSEHVLSDATYKSTYENFSLITGGTTDRNKHLNPIGIAITRHDTEEDFGFFFRQSKELMKDIDSDESEVEESVPKRARIESNNQDICDKETKLCDLCGAQMKKRRYLACPNKCVKNCRI
ncbi:unnamed protein product [Brachionus calyciflorus]|uniref:Uncharacterized protein n=1 Tax=Brachionus calyciflorus TaxID=104777 RepID=A0A814E7X9_9BILA|nr:unnamed protein product [Brachionus calyciflorus]